MLVVQILKPVFEHRAIDFGENVFSNLDLVIGRDAEDSDIVCTMVDLAETESV